ncbi:protein GRISEA [Aspergillus awamori]|uniref:Copper-fist domain-containing protein n=2 Tax=Aspergillus TaxID=5052 RepID=A0A3F3QH15_9EURO|nr:hypothetical protein BDQ94DRAFT_134220 [Aspergillus welwitschiae]GCB22763.1 protein GRISEA [Aspergillus awamori]GKZ62355.1 hypothetical protein AnigIFM49718_009442 [Aspergillus niger]RDH38578.1 hypothetical protein BDQ94DRAFT_134220 [Aspergillus welwitschiae]GKZ69286.1 hypothetical protein AnigIFM50267_004481 [Aspergillus niger]GLA05048.1 hypothetical protein AnigIFM60653_005117 [Aspergillus niger]
MPLDEEGAKWSCEPCIRGHRSSKCQHFDRMMMKVPKAGRPLARCPHPKGTCSCQKLYAFMIRIPKGSTCLCRPVYQVPADAAESASTTPIPAPPIPIAAPNKIQKPIKRQVKTAPENLTKALNSISEFGNQQLEHGKLGRPSPYTAQEQRLSSSYDIIKQEPTPSHKAFERASEDKAPQGGSCCSRKPQPPQTITPDVQAPAVQRSCCSKSKPAAQDVEKEGSILDSSDYFHPPVFDTDNARYTPNSIPQVSTWQDFQAAKQSQYMQPFALPVSESGYLPMAGPAADIRPKPLDFQHPHAFNNYDLFSNQTSQPPSENTQNVVADPKCTASEVAHDCSCGDGCQCLGCASHPFNNTTRQHVQQMGLLVALNDDEQSPERLNSHRGSPLQSQPPDFSSLQYSFTNFGNPLGEGFHPVAMHPYAQQSTDPGHVNKGYSSPPADYLGQQLMVPSEYYTLEYPVGLPSACVDTTGSCQCGNDCTCVGCLTHSGHNGLPLEPAMPESNWDHMNLPGFSMDAAGHSTSQMPVMDNFVAHSNSML